MTTNDRTDRKRDDETGHWRPEYPAADVLEFIESADGVVTSGDVREAIGCSYDTARRRLADLEQQGKLEKSEIAGTFVYSLAQ